jgi:kynurenine formamidase
MTVIDLTMSLDEAHAYPGEPEPGMSGLATLDKEGWNSTQLTLTSHSGTHIDAPYHLLPEGKRLGDFPLETFMGEGIVLDIRSGEPDLSNVKEGDIVLFCAGEDGILDESTALSLIEKKVKMVGVDSPSPDKPPFTVHKLLLKNDILIVENLFNLERLLGKRCMLYILPLKFGGADGAPCRAVAVL